MGIKKSNYKSKFNEVSIATNHAVIMTKDTISHLISLTEIQFPMNVRLVTGVFALKVDMISAQYSHKQQISVINSPKDCCQKML